MFKKILLLVGFFNNPIFILVLFNLANVVNLCFQIIASKNLNFLEFSLFFSFISITNIFLGPFISVQLYIQQSLVKNKKNFKYNFENFIPFCLRIFIIVQIVFAVIYFILLETVKNKVNYYDNNFYILFFIYFSLSMFLIIPGGILYSERKYKSAHFIVLAIDVLRVLLFYFLIDKIDNKIEFMVSLNILYAFLCIFLMTVKMEFNIYKSLISIFYLKDFFKRSKTFFSSFIKFVFYSACLPAITQLDIIFIKFLFSDEISSSYIVVSTFGKIIFIIPAVLQGYLFNESYFLEKKKLIYNYVFVLFLSIIILVISLFVIDFIIVLLYGEVYLLTIDAFKIITISFLLISFSNLMINNLLVKEKYKFLFILYLSIALYIFLNLISNESYNQIALNLLYSSIILFVGISLNFYYTLIMRNEK